MKEREMWRRGRCEGEEVDERKVKEREMWRRSG